MHYQSSYAQLLWNICWWILKFVIENDFDAVPTSDEVYFSGSKYTLDDENEPFHYENSYFEN